MLIQAGAVQAQGITRGLSKGTGKAAESAAKGASSAVRKAPKVKLPSVRPTVPSRSVGTVVYPAAGAPSVQGISPQVEIQRLEQSLQNLRKENFQLKTALHNIGSRPSLARATFQAAETTDRPTNPFSGTAFKTVYNGQEEVFGVVAAHAIARSTTDRALRRHFTMSVFDGEKMVELPAEVVQLSSPSMLDVALVKFPAEAEGFFHPLTISQAPLSLGDMLSSQGFAGNKDVNVPARRITRVKNFSIHTSLPVARGERPGLCGSAVVNDKEELVGIHTGSSYDRYDERFDTGYATGASFLNTLVEAYHNGGEATFPLILNKREILSLNVDEYISNISFQNADGKQQWQQGFEGKFSFSKVEEMLEIYSPRYITITVRRATWNPSNPEVMLENRASHDLTKTTYKYDWKTREIVSVTRAKDKARK